MLEEKSSSIHLLPEHIIDQIKAGEVVERPANVLKELLENSVDAGSSEIKVTIRDNGLELIAIEDNGKGMAFSDLPYAFCRHATSKITSFEDIYRLNTYGFRGEALASISSVARVSCHSAPAKDLESGGRITIHGAQTIEHAHYKPNHSGTALYIKDLFYNTPVRLKFVKSKTSEKNALKRIINAFLVTNPHIKFSVSWDDADREIYSALPDDSNENKQKRIAKVISHKVRKYNIVSTDSSYLNYQVNAFVSKESSKGYAGKHHYLFINGRLFTDKKIHQIIIRNLEKFWAFGQTGHYFVEIHAPENEIDVNVHPNKTLIKFLKSNEIFSLISATMKKLIQENVNDTAPVAEELGLETELTRAQQLDNLLFNNQSPEQLNTREFTTADRVGLGQFDMFNSQAEQEVFQIDRSIFILKDLNQGMCFLNMERGLSLLLTNIFSKDDPERTPLLISEPINFPPQKNENTLFNILDEIGFELDRIDPTTIVLRSTPSLLESFNYKEIVHSLVNYLETETANFSDIDFSNVQFSEPHVISLLQEVNSIELMKQNVIKKIIAKDIKKYFFKKKKS